MQVGQASLFFGPGIKNRQVNSQLLNLSSTLSPLKPLPCDIEKSEGILSACHKEAEIYLISFSDLLRQFEHYCTSQLPGKNFKFNFCTKFD